MDKTQSVLDALRGSQDNLQEAILDLDPLANRKGVAAIRHLYALTQMLVEDLETE